MSRFKDISSVAQKEVTKSNSTLFLNVLPVGSVLAWSGHLFSSVVMPQHLGIRMPTI